MKEKTALSQLIDYLNNHKVLSLTAISAIKLDAKCSELLELEKKQHDRSFAQGVDYIHTGLTFEPYFTDTYEQK